MRKKILILITLFICVYGFAQDYTIQERLEYDVILEGLTVETFNTLEDAQQYVDDNTIPSGTYMFDKYEWSIKEGVVTYEEALVNREQINDAITYAHNNGFTVFEIDNIDAYFEVSAINFGNLTHREAIQIPSDFHFKMGDNCTLRVQPNALPAYALLSARSADNVKITGGKLLGDKYEHTYATGTQLDTHELGFGIYFVGVTNSIVDGVFVDDMTGDCFAVHSTGARNHNGTENPKYDYSKNIILRNCIFKGSRRNNLSFIDVIGLLMEDCIVEGAGEGGKTVRGEPKSSKGVAPRCGIDLEARRSWDTQNNKLKESQKVSEIIIRRCEFTNSYGSDINLFTCDNVEIYDCTFDSPITTIYLAQDIKIHNNIMTASDYEGGNTYCGIKTKSYISPNTQEEFVKNIEIYENTITGFDAGLIIGGDNINVHDNIILNSVNSGVSLSSGNNLSFSNNIIESELINSKGYYQNRSVVINGLSLVNEVVKGDYYGLLFKGLISPIDNPAIIDNCSFTARFRTVDIRNSSNIIIKNSDTGTINQSNSINITQINNN